MLAEQIMNKYAPFVGKHEFDHNLLRKNLIVHNQQKYNNFSHQHNVFMHINSESKNKVIMNLCIWIVTEFKKLNLNKNYVMFNYIVRCKHIMNKLKSCYDGYNINFYNNFCKDLVKLLSKDKIINYIIAELKKDEKILKIYYQKLYTLFDNSKLNFQFKKNIVKKYFDINFKNDDVNRFNSVKIINHLKELEPILVTEEEKNLFKYQYLIEFLNYSNTIKFINYTTLHKNFFDLLKIKNLNAKDEIKNLFNYMYIFKSKTDFLNNKFFIVFSTIIKNNNYLDKNLILKFLDNDFLEYICLVFHHELLESKINTDNVNEYISYLKIILKILNEDYIKNMLNLVDNKVLVFLNKYIKFLKKRIIFNKDFKLENEENIYLNLKHEKSINLNKLDAVINDIKISITCNNKLSKTKLSLNDDTYDSLLKNKFDEIKGKIEPYYFSKYTNKNIKLFKIDGTGNSDLDLAIKISKNNLKQRLMHDSKIEISETEGIYDFNAKINNKLVRIKANLREFYFLNYFFKDSSNITEYEIFEKEKELNYKNNELQKTLYKLILANLVVKTIDNNFTLNKKLNIDDIDLYDYQYDFKINNNNKNKHKERSKDDKVFITQAHIVKLIKPYSDISVKLDAIYRQTEFNVKKYFKLCESVFYDAIEKLILKNMCRVHNSNGDVEIKKGIEFIVQIKKLCNEDDLQIRYVV